MILFFVILISLFCVILFFFFYSCKPNRDMSYFSSRRIELASFLRIDQVATQIFFMMKKSWDPYQLNRIIQTHTILLIRKASPSPSHVSALFCQKLRGYVLILKILKQFLISCFELKKKCKTDLFFCCCCCWYAGLEGCQYK